MPTPIRFPASRFDQIPILRAIYELEAERLSGPRPDHKALGALLWTKKELLTRVGPQLSETVDDLLQWMSAEENLLVVRGHDETKYATRVGETIRVLGHTYEYWDNPQPSIEALRWVIEDKRVPRRDVSLKDAQERILAHAKGRGFLDLEGLEEAVGAVLDALRKKNGGQKVFVSGFQVDAWLHGIEGLLFRRPRTRLNEVLVADVGAGKTWGFFVPTLVALIYGKIIGDRTSHIFLYPRTALAKDQFGELVAIVDRVQNYALDCHLEHGSSYEGSVKEGVRKRYLERGPPDLIVSTLETIKRRLMNRDFARPMAGRIRRMVLDEVHLVAGLSGTNVARVIARARASLAHQHASFTAVSATIAVPDEHAAIVFGVSAESFDVIRPEAGSLEVVGIVHHVFMRPKVATSVLGTLVNLTSGLVHNRNPSPYNRRAGGGRTLCFADNLEALGRWNADFKENERTESRWRGRQHPAAADPDSWTRQQREIPYALRFADPLDRRLAVSGGRLSADGNGKPFADLAIVGQGPVCDRCHSGERIVLGTVEGKENVRELGRLVIRYPFDPQDESPEYALQHPLFERDSLVVGTLDACPFLNAGACHWFNRFDGNSERIPGTDRFEYRSVARSAVHSSKESNVNLEDAGTNLEDQVFKAPVDRVYDIKGARQQVSIDVVFASPSLEVGIDISDVTEEVLFKSIRNIASYRQKVGRAGREVGTDTVVVCMLTNRPIDRHYYRQPAKLVATGTIEPVPMKDSNLPLFRNSLYLGVWDFLAHHGVVGDAISPAKDGDVLRFTAELTAALARLANGREEMVRYLRRIVPASAGVRAADYDEAIEQVRVELEFLLQPLPSYVSVTGAAAIADLMALGTRRPAPLVEQDSGVTDAIHELDAAVEAARVAIGRVPEPPAVLADAGQRLRSGAIDEALIAEIQGWVPAVQALEAAAEGTRGRSFKKVRLACETLHSLLLELQEVAPSGDLRVLHFVEELRMMRKEDAWQRYYLSSLLERSATFKRMKRDRAFVHLPTLFTNPYEPTVEVSEIRGEGREYALATVPLQEALFGFLPGSWTFRLAGGPYKVQTGAVEVTEEGLTADPTEESLNGHRTTEMRVVKGPPWVSDRIRVFQPTRLLVRALNDKYVPVNPADGRVVDGDEMESQDRDRITRLKIPQTYQERWVAIDGGPSFEVLPEEHSLAALVVSADGTETSATEHRAELLHPLRASGISRLVWHPKMDVTEYVYGVARAFSSRTVQGTDVVYRNRGGSRVALGRNFLTEGLSLELDGENARRVVERIAARMRDDVDGPFASSIVQFLGSAIRSSQLLGGNGNPSAFDTQNLINAATFVVLARRIPISLQALRQALLDICKGEQTVAPLVRQYFDAVAGNLRDEVADEGGEPAPGAMEGGAGFRALCRSIATNDFSPDQELEDWIAHTLLNTLGMVSIQALQRFSGVPEENIGYLPDFEAVDGNIFRVYLFDRDSNGNGACDLVRRFAHVLSLQRLAVGRANDVLPSSDFLSILEEELLQCPQFHTDIDALARHAFDGQGMKELSYVGIYSEEVAHVAADTWKRLGVRGPRDAWRLPLLHRAYAPIAETEDLAADDVYRATESCWTGCPECVIGDSMLMGPVMGSFYTNKAFLDAWFTEIRGAGGAYQVLRLSELVDGTAKAHVGDLTRLAMRREGQLIRASNLPYTLGIEASRAEPDAEPLLVLRIGDVARLSLHAGEPTGTTTGMGLGRLVQFHLLTSAFLAACRLLPPARCNVTFAYYDIRDVSLDESGASRRIISALEGLARRPIRVRRLSDLVRLLLQLDFDVTICVDENRANERPVREFLEAAAIERTGRARILTKNIGQASMHTKLLISPLGAISGTANMTFSGMNTNDELCLHEHYGTGRYKDLRQAASDIILGAKAWTPSRSTAG